MSNIIVETKCYLNKLERKQKYLSGLLRAYKLPNCCQPFKNPIQHLKFKNPYH